MKIVLSEENTNKYASWATIMLISYQAILMAVSTFLDRFVAVTSLDAWVSYIVMLFLILMAFINCFHVSRTGRGTTQSIIYICGILIYLGNMVVFSQNRQYMFTEIGDLLGNPFYIFAIYSLPAYLFVSRITNIEYFVACLKNVAVFVVIGNFFAAIIFLSFGSSVEYMSFSYSILPHTLFLLLYGIHKQKKIYTMISVVGIISILSFGARGAFLSIVIALILYLIICPKKGRKIFAWSVLIAVVASIAFFYDQIASSLSRVLIGFGINSRSLEKVLSNSFFVSGTRMRIYETIYNNIALYPKGLYADRQFFYITGYHYAHNIILEVLIEWGWILGLLLIILLIMHSIKTLKIDSEYRYFAIVLFCSGVIKLLVSGSYLSQEPVFYAFLGLGAALSIKK